MSPESTSAALSRAEPPGAEELDAVPVRRFGTWAASALTLLGVLMLGHALISNRNFEWGVVGHYLLDATVLAGLGRTLELTTVIMILSVVFATFVAVARLSRNPVLSLTSLAFVWFFRGTPILVQLIFWFNLSALYAHVSLGVPFGPGLLTATTNSLITPFLAAVIAFTLNETAYMAEIIRAGIQSIDHGQREAAAALGLTRTQTFRKVVLPQAMRVVIPPTVNETISLLKTTSLVSVITLPELLYSAQIIYSRTFETIPLLIVVSLWYLAITTVMTAIQAFLERRYGRGVTPYAAPRRRRIRRTTVSAHDAFLPGERSMPR
jgi:polar amino acid transport system permease protein